MGHDPGPVGGHHDLGADGRLHRESASRTGAERTLGKPYPSSSKALFSYERSSSRRLARKPEARDPEAYVNFSASGMPLVRLVELFDDFFPGQILMPVSKMQEKVTTDEELRQIMLGDLGEYLGLVPVRTPLPGRATPPTDAEV